MLASNRVGSLLLYLFLHIAGAVARGGRKGGGEEEGGGKSGGEGGGGTTEHAPDPADVGSDLADAISNLYGLGSSISLDPSTAVSIITIIVAILSVFQLALALSRFKRLPPSPPDPGLPYDVGVLFRVFLAAYTATYTVYNALFVTYFSALGDPTFNLPPAFGIGVAATNQVSTALFYAIFLTIIAYRQRVRLGRQVKLFNFKAFVDSLLLATILFLGVAEDIIAGISTSGGVAIKNITLVIQVFSFIASLDVVVSSWIASTRLTNSKIQDKIINVCARVVSPVVLVGGIYGITKAAIEHNVDPSTFNSGALLIATVVIQGVVSIVATMYALTMGAPPPRRQGTVEDTQTPPI